MWSVLKCYNREVWCSVQFCSLWKSVKRGLEHLKLKKSPLLEADARERLVKTQQAGNGLAGAVVIWELWRLAVAL
jgi:hypothetical protein